MEYSIFFKFLTALFAIINPFINLPIFISLTPNQNTNKIKNQSIFAVTIIMFLTLFAGNKVLSILGINSSAFQTAGGIIIFLIALSMAQGNPSNVQSSENERKDRKTHQNPAIVPLALPVLAGPGTIATIIIYHNYFVGTEGYIAASIAILICILLLWIIFSYADRIKKLLGLTGTKIIARILAILLASIAVEMVANGLKELLPL